MMDESLISNLVGIIDYTMFHNCCSGFATLFIRSLTLLITPCTSLASFHGMARCRGLRSDGHFGPQTQAGRSHLWRGSTLARGRGWNACNLSLFVRPRRGSWCLARDLRAMGRRGDRQARLSSSRVAAKMRYLFRGARTCSRYFRATTGWDGTTAVHRVFQGLVLYIRVMFPLPRGD